MNGLIGARVPEWLDPDDDRTARAAWSRLVEPGDQTAGRVVARLGAGPALLALLERPATLAAFAGPGVRGGIPTARWRARLEELDPFRDLGTVARFGGRLLVPGDAGWPTGLDSLGDRVPFALWTRGPLALEVGCARAAALVGSRHCTGYGEWVSTELAGGCAERGITVVSGAAYGIDACAHRGALAGGGATIAVLACGVDRAYPRGNERLIERIAGEHAVVSEVPPGSSPTRWRFIQRNRLIAALSLATVVVEAGWRSGAAITARETVDLGRPLGAVPGPVTSTSSAGCHRLLREGAICVTEASELAELVWPIGEQLTLALPSQASIPDAVHDGLDPVDLQVFDALPLRRRVDVDRLSRTAGLDPSSVAAAVGRLEMRGLAESRAGLWCRARPGDSSRASS